ncbi:Rieske domain-containing protein, partial [Globisporangium splendens]
MWGSRSSNSGGRSSSRGAGASARPTPTLRYEDEDALFLRLQREQEAAKYLWFNSFVRPEGTKVEINGKDVAIFKNNGEFFAVDDTCPHQGASLHLGDIEEIDGMVYRLESSRWNRHRLMGIKQSKTSSSQSAPAPEPLALPKTSAGVIVRIPDPASGASTFHHNPRFVAPMTVSDILHNGESQALPVGGNQVMVARAGIKNDALRGKIVYVTKPPRQSAARGTGS